MRPPAVARAGVSSRRAVGLYRRALRVGAPLVLLLGVLLRLLLLGTPESLEMDEQMLAVSIATRPAWALLAPLELQQVAAPLFLLLERAVVVVAGVRDTAFRVVPFVAAAATPFVVLLFARAMRLRAEPRLLAVAVACLAPEPLLFAAVAKPYAMDALVAALLVLLAARLLDAPEERARWAWLIAGGVVALALSVPAVFVLAGVGAALLASPRVRRWPGAWRPIALAAALWAATFGTLYFTVYRPASGDAGLRRFWAGHYLADQLTSADGPGAVASALADVVAVPLVGVGEVVPTRYLLLLVPLLTLAGWAWLARRRGLAPALLVLIPVVAGVAASLLRAYPLRGRLLQFTAPLLCVAIGAGAWAVCGAWRGAARRAAFVLLAAALLLPALRHSVFRLRHAAQWDAAAPIARDLLARAPEGASVYVYARGAPAWLLYSTDWRAPDTARVARLLGAMRRLGFNSGYVPSRGDSVGEREGADLVFPFGEGQELIGVPPGTGPDDAGRASPDPDPGWAEHEARRIRAAARPEVWLYLTHIRPEVATRLLDAVRAAGGRETYVRTLHDTRVYRFTFPDYDGAPRDERGGQS